MNTTVQFFRNPLLLPSGSPLLRWQPSLVRCLWGEEEKAKEGTRKAHGGGAHGLVVVVAWVEGVGLAGALVN